MSSGSPFHYNDIGNPLARNLLHFVDFPEHLRSCEISHQSANSRSTEPTAHPAAHLRRDQGKTEFGIDYGVIVCAMRHESEGANRRMLKAAREFLGNGVCAADLAGNEAAFPMSLFMELFGEVRRLEMPFTIHAGECGSVQNILDAVQCGASRIGHGIALRGQKEAIAFCRDRQIGIEMCPLSNMQTKAVKDPAEYPIQDF